ncbi:cytochrome c oxidase subunit II [Natrarchaeobius chitinivorans]|uniref:Cytochrome C oxidase subunit II n=1 Tax=Natrarchaeobius chitinivorans TaxID=1679083 RepID=A0A3N6MCE5_NATCH|nr:cytochrome c oxidase subunit II [Natrarchaeobius chitinivorans]RQG94200.1 cytochrome C oxidase subunit II [Natrarchaeobius chitinivorans]
MNIHTYERLWIVGAMVLIVGFIATITYGSVGLGITMIDDEEETLAPDEIGEDERFADPRVEQVGEDEYAAYVVAQTFVFQPDPIEIPADSEVTFYVTSRDVIHSFTVVGTNTNTMVIPGEVATMTVEFDEPGEYGVICNEYCGAGHHDMEGELTVVEAEEFDLTDLAVDAPDEVEPGEEVELTATVENGLLEEVETTLTVEIGEETIEEEVVVEGGTSEEITTSVDADDLGEGDHDWTVEVDDESDGGTVTVGTDDGGDES